MTLKTPAQIAAITFETERIAAVIALGDFNAVCWKPSDDLKLFRVWNTANRTRLVIAQSAACAVRLATQSGHLKDDHNGVVAPIEGEELASLRPTGSALGKAIEGGLPGVVKNVGANIMIEGRDVIYIPLAVVSER